MKQGERIGQILRILSEKHNASTKYLSTVLDASESTVRRDIEFLTSVRDEVRKVHGGVVMEGDRGDSEYMFELKANVNVELKKRIARKVVDMLDDNDSVLLDSGTTCLQIASHIHQKQTLRIATTDLQVAAELAKHEHIESIVIGGHIRPGYYTIGDAFAVEMLDHFSIDKAVVGADAVTIDSGVTNLAMFEVGVKRKILEIAKSKILVVDYTKFGTSTFYKVAPLSRFSTVVTNRELDESYISAMRDMGIEVILT